MGKIAGLLPKIPQELPDFLIALAAALTVSLTLSYFFPLKGKPAELDLPTRIETLTTSLNSAAQTIGQIEGEIKQRQELVRRLEREAETASKLATLNKEQLDAVAQVLKGEIQSEQRQGFWSSQLFALFYAALGVVLSEFYRFLVRWRRRQRPLHIP